MQKIVCIVGPTASGKSALAVELAKKFNGEIISADSRQVYRGLDIGTGKITKKEMRGVPHHLLDIASPKRTFTAHDFVKKARAAIEDIASRGKLPIVVGGTGFYIDALVGRISLPDVPANTILRKELGKKSAEELYAQLQTLDPERSATIDQHNPVRLIRAIEIAASGKAAAPSAPPPYEVCWLGLTLPFSDLEKKIAARLKTRLRTGMIAEAKRLHTEGLSYKRMETLGLEYRYLARLLQKHLTRKELETELLQQIRQYAKRQITYWKRNAHIHWCTPKETQRCIDQVRAFVLS